MSPKLFLLYGIIHVHVTYAHNSVPLAVPHPAWTFDLSLELGSKTVGISDDTRKT